MQIAIFDWLLFWWIVRIIIMCHMFSYVVVLKGFCFMFRFVYARMHLVIFCLCYRSAFSAFLPFGVTINEWKNDCTLTKTDCYSSDDREMLLICFSVLKLVRNNDWLLGRIHIDTSTGCRLFIRVKLVRVERSWSPVQAQTLVIQSPLKIWWKLWNTLPVIQSRVLTQHWHVVCSSEVCTVWWQVKVCACTTLAEKCLLNVWVTAPYSFRARTVTSDMAGIRQLSAKFHQVLIHFTVF